jgi:hypothetical protein
MGIYKVSDKYDIERLLQPTASHLRQVLGATDDEKTVDSVIRKHYSTCLSPGSIMGCSIASTTLTLRTVLRMEDFVTLLKLYPVFGADVAVYHFTQEKSILRRK